MTSEAPVSHAEAIERTERIRNADRYTAREKALLTEHYEIECLLAEALGYEPYPPGSPGYSPDQVNYVTGDHTAVTLAMEAARIIKDLRDGAPQEVPDTGISEWPGSTVGDGQERRIRDRIARDLHLDRFHDQGSMRPDSWYAAMRHAFGIVTRGRR